MGVSTGDNEDTTEVVRKLLQERARFAKICVNMGKCLQAQRAEICSVAREFAVQVKKEPGSAAFLAFALDEDDMDDYEIDYFNNLSQKNTYCSLRSIRRRREERI